jgi:hypothetical protein
VYVDRNGIVYCTDYNAGLYIRITLADGRRANIQRAGAQPIAGADGQSVQWIVRLDIGAPGDMPIHAPAKLRA